MTKVSASFTKPMNGKRSVTLSPSPAVTDITAESQRLESFCSHQQVLSVRQPDIGLDAIIAIHDTRLGPALGGCRAMPYASYDDALTDVLRLSHAMTYKAAMTGLGLGGGKTVILVDPATKPSEELFRGLGRAIETLGGQYIGAEDSGTSVQSMDWISEETRYVIGTSARGGDPSRMTAMGVMAGLRQAVRHRLGKPSVAGITVAVQGLGHVGAILCDLLAAEGAKLIVSDINQKRVAAMAEIHGAVAAAPDAIHRSAADVFAPCALGAVLNDQTIPELNCAVVAGSANNQLDHDGNGDALHDRHILYAPDYVINAGGLISAGVGWFGDDPNGPEASAQVENIGRTLATIFDRSQAEIMTPAAIANIMAEERLLQTPLSRPAGRREIA